MSIEDKSDDFFERTETLILRHSLSAYYFFLFIPIGAAISFFPAWMRDFDLSAAQIGSIIATGYISKIGVNPVFAYLAQRFGIRRALLAGLACLSAAASSIFALSTDAATVSAAFLVWLVVGSPIVPLGESLVVSSLRRSGHSYGSSRLWGSAAVAATAVFMGIALEYDQRVLAVSVIPLAYLCLCALFLLVEDTQEADRRSAKIPAALGDSPPVVWLRPFIAFVAIAAPLQALHGLYYAYNVIHFTELGISNMMISALWVVAVCGELAIYTLARARLERLAVRTMILIAAAAGVGRWLILGTVEAIPLLFAAQLLQGLTLAALALSVAKYFVEDDSPGATTMKITLYNGFAFGLLQAAAVYIGGVIFDAWSGEGVFYFAAAVAGGSLLLGAVAFPRRSDGR